MIFLSLRGLIGMNLVKLTGVKLLFFLSFLGRIGVKLVEITGVWRGPGTWLCLHSSLDSHFPTLLLMLTLTDLTETIFLSMRGPIGVNLVTLTGVKLLLLLS